MTNILLAAILVANLLMWWNLRAWFVRVWHRLNRLPPRVTGKSPNGAVTYYAEDE